MNKQELLDKENTTPKEWAAQQFVMRMSKTRLEAVRRVFSEVDKVLYKTVGKKLTWEDVCKAQDIATKLANDENVELYSEEIHTSVQPGANDKNVLNKK